MGNEGSMLRITFCYSAQENGNHAFVLLLLLLYGLLSIGVTSIIKERGEKRLRRE